MKLVYFLAGVALFITVLFIPNPMGEWDRIPIVESIVGDSGVANAVSGIIFRNRLYDTVFEVIVFTIAILGVRFLLSDEEPTDNFYRLSDPTSRVLARLGATIAAMVSIELSIRGHLSPGGGFAAGIAGGTAIGLVAMTSSPDKMEKIYQRWNAAIWEKVSVLVFIILAGITMMGWELPQGTLGDLFSGGIVPILNFLVAIKVALGSWAVILLFIRYRGLL